MKVKLTSQLEKIQIGDSGLTGKPLVTHDDNVGYSSYHVTLNAGEEHKIQSAFGSQDVNHIYYCIAGEVTFNCSEGTQVTLQADHVLALTGAMQAHIKVKQMSHIYITYIQQSETGPYPDRAYHLSMKDIVGTQRDVDWFKGRSRRFLLKKDGFNVTLTNTSVYKEAIAPMQYKNHMETVYYIKGDVKYTWNNGENAQSFKQASAEEGDGMALTMDKHDAHIAYGGTTESNTICIFSPPLGGLETHSFNKNDPTSPSSY